MSKEIKKVKTLKKGSIHLEQEENYRSQFANPYVAAKYGYIDEVIEPRNTRYRIIRALESLVNKRDTNPPKKHSNIPL
jgi:acetyl-CoA carboxylase carboxyltransferase component